MHTCYSPDSLTSPERVAARCRAVGLDCIAVTDHNTILGARALREQASLQVIVGEEVRTTGGDIVGLFLQEEVPQGLDVLQAARCVRAQGGLVLIPHPFDTVRNSVLTAEALEAVLPYTDLIETFNARNTFRRSDERASALAVQRGIPGCAVSDAHTLRELGRTYVRMPGFDGTPEGLIRSLGNGTVMRRRSSPLVHFASSYSRVHRRLFGSRAC